MCQRKAQGFGSGAQSVLPCSSLICVATEFLWGGSLPSGSFSEFGKGVILLEGDSLTISGSGFNGGCLAGVGTLPRCTHTYSYIFTLSAIPLPPLTLPPPLCPFAVLPCYFRDTTRDAPNWACRSQELCLLECASTHSIQTHHTGTHAYTPATHRITHTCMYTCVPSPRKWQTAACLLLLVYFHMHGTRQVYHLYAGTLMHMCVFTWRCVLHAPIHLYM